MALVKWRRSQRHQSKPVLSVVSNGFDAVVVYANPSVGVSDGDVEGKVVEDSVVSGGEIKLRERGICDYEFGLFGKEDQPEYEEGQQEAEDDVVEDAEGAGAAAMPWRHGKMKIKKWILWNGKVV